MKSKVCLILPAVLFCFLASKSDAALIAYWNFNDLSTTNSVPSNANQTSYTPTVGSASLTLVGWSSRAGTSSPHGISNFGGSSINSISPDPAGQSLALQASNASTGTPNNGASLVLSFATVDLEDVVLTFATQKTSTGFASNQLAYSTDGTNYTDFGATYNPATSFGLQTFDLSSITALDDQATAFIRITFNGATGNSGNNRIDNLQITAVPEPAAALLGGIGLLGLLRRRRA